MLQVKTKEQMGFIAKILNEEVSFRKLPVDRFYTTKGTVITFDKMAEIIDYLRKEDNARRKKARWAAMKSEIDGLWVSGDTVFLKGAEKDEAVKFIQSLGEFGYCVDTLMEEYNKTGKITI